MTNLTETETWEEGVYQIELTDPVVGGADGISNRQAKQLANRTAWLRSEILAHATSLSGKQPLDQTLTALAALAIAADRLIYGTGVDTFATTPLTAFARTLLDDVDAATMRATLGAAPLASPAMTGSPSAPTPPQFDRSTSLATTEFVQRALGNYAGLDAVNETSQLPVSSIGRGVLLYSASACTLTLPPSASAPAGSVVKLHNDNTGVWSVVPSGTDVLRSANAATNIAPLSLGAGDNAELVSNGAGIWRLVGGSVSLKYAQLFAAAHSTSGWQKLPSGQIEQWGTVSVPASNSPQVVTLPITFPNAILTGVCSFTGASQGSCGIALTSTSQVTLTNSHSAVQTVRWIVKGN